MSGDWITEVVSSELGKMHSFFLFLWMWMQCLSGMFGQATQFTRTDARLCSPFAVVELGVSPGMKINPGDGAFVVSQLIADLKGL